ncbi:glycosyltransferase [Aureimonas sp. AU12]|uniref:glycosyltransferase n=1 Tax=Aureimonas sp. AU12 TaxID=1638161 RepID=UPI0007853CFA|nr:glycosyltransferase [Aureimonas sp. AU12]
MDAFGSVAPAPSPGSARQVEAPTTTILIPTTGDGRAEEIVRTYLADPAAHEILVVIDNPAADLAAMSAPFAGEARVRFLQNERQIGLTRSLNKAIAVSTGDLILRNDDDDLPEPTRATETIAHFVAHPECDLLFTYALGLDVTSGKTWTIGGPTDDAGIKRELASRNFIVHSSLAFRKSSTAPIGHYDETFRYAQDYDLYLRAIRAGLTFGAIPKILVTRTYHGNSITVSKRRRQMLYSFAARLIHDSESQGPVSPWRTMVTYTKLLLIPSWLRSVRRRLGHGR